MNVLPDTNVWIASLITRGACSDLIEDLISEHKLVTTDWILEEVTEVLERKFDYSEEASEGVTEFLCKICDVDSVSGPPPEIITSDVDDNYILLSARKTGTDLIVTGDQDLLDVEEWKGIPIIEPGNFWEYAQSQR